MYKLMKKRFYKKFHELIKENPDFIVEVEFSGSDYVKGTMTLKSNLLDVREFEMVYHEARTIKAGGGWRVL